MLVKKNSAADNYYRVELYKNKEHKTWLVHRMVALAFLPKMTGKEFVNHIDGNRNNNFVNNLEWCTQKENNNHAFDNGLIQTGHQIILIDNETNESYSFRSEAKASEFLGKAHGYLSNYMRKGKTNYSKYTIKEVQ